MFLRTLCVLCVLGVGSTWAHAQVEMPDPKQMSGIPRPVGVNELPNGSVSIRLIRGDLANRIIDHPVELNVNGKPLPARTDAEGRAQFDKLPAGATLKAVAVIDGERLESQTFTTPALGGIRVMLVATDKEKEAQKAAEAAAPAITGQVVLGGDTRIIIEPGDEDINVFYILDIMNNARAPVNPATAFEFELPEGSLGASLFEDSTKLALVTGTHVRVNGPFPPGKTSLAIGSRLPVTSGSLEIRQQFPAMVEQLMVLVPKVGSTQLSSPQIARQEEVPRSGQVVIAAAGPAVPAGQPIVLQLSNLPHHSQTPRLMAVGIAVAIALIGFFVARRPGTVADQQRDERKRLMARREKLFQELVKLEQDHRNGRVAPARYTARREELFVTLERVYGALDTDDAGPDPGDRTGLAA